METKFQTSFIPRKTAAPTGMAGNIPVVHRSKSSILMTIATVIFIGSLLAAGGSYAWKYTLISSQETYKKLLAERREQFDLDLIEQLKQVNIKINLARQLMANHLATSQIFDVVSRLTAERVRFTNMELTTGVTGSVAELKLSMSGVGSNFSTVAFQSDVLGQLQEYNLRKIVKNPILADPNESENGTVSFKFSATIDPKSISYEKSVTPAAPAIETPPTQ